MKALVTGGAGFIGCHLARLLLQQGHQVAVLDDLSSGRSQNLPQTHQLEFIKGDVRDPQALDRAMAGAQAVFHLAALGSDPHSQEDAVNQSSVNLLGTIEVLRAARRHSVVRVIYSSCAEVFGELKTVPVSEDHPLEPRSPHGVSKLAGEKMCQAFWATYGLSTVCLRYFNVYGPYQRLETDEHVIPVFARRLLQRQTLDIFGDGEQIRDFIHVKDVAQANYLAAQARNATGVFNLGSGHRVTINRLAAMMGEALDLEPRLIHRRARPNQARHSLPDIGRARRELDFAPRVELRAGLVEYLQWARGELRRGDR